MFVNKNVVKRGLGIVSLVGASLAMSQVSVAQTSMEHADHNALSGEMKMNNSMGNMKGKMGSMQMTGDADYDFASMMRMHHENGVEMAEAELLHGKDATLKKMAKEIVDSQKKEIREFDQWLEKHPHADPKAMSKPK